MRKYHLITFLLIENWTNGRVPIRTGRNIEQERLPMDNVLICDIKEDIAKCIIEGSNDLRRNIISLLSIIVQETYQISEAGGDQCAINHMEQKMKPAQLFCILVDRPFFRAG